MADPQASSAAQVSENAPRWPDREFGASLLRPSTFNLVEVFGAFLLMLVVWFAGRIFLITFGGVLLAVFFSSLARWLSRATFLSYGWALALIVAAIVALMSGGFLLVGSRLVNQANEFSRYVPNSLKQIEDYLNDYSWGKWILEQSPEWGKSLAQGSLPSRLTDVASSIVDFAVAVVIMLFVGLYCAAEPEVYTNGLVRLVPINRRERAREIIQAVGYNLRWWLIGQMFSMVCVGIVTGVGLSIAGAPLALTLGLLAGALEIIPNVGPVLWLIPAALVALTEGTTMVMHVILIYAVTHMFESYILVPLVQRRAVFLPPMISILAAVLLGLLGGILGLLVAAPLTLVVMLLVKMLYVEDRLGDRSLVVAGEKK